MVIYLLVGHGLVGMALWWILADLSAGVRMSTGLLLTAAIATFFVTASRRVRRLRSEYEGQPPQVLRHDGSGERRRRDPGGDDPEFFVSDRW